MVRLANSLGMLIIVLQEDSNSANCFATITYEICKSEYCYEEGSLRGGASMSAGNNLEGWCQFLDGTNRCRAEKLLSR